MTLQRLPEELLLEIMSFLDVPGLYFIRQVSSKFARLFGDRQFDQWRSTEKHDRSRPRHLRWYGGKIVLFHTAHLISSTTALPNVKKRGNVKKLPRKVFDLLADCDFEFPSDHHTRHAAANQIISLLDRQKLCEPCRSVRDGLDFERLVHSVVDTCVWCYECKKRYRETLSSLEPEPQEAFNYWSFWDSAYKCYPTGRYCAVPHGQARLCKHKHITFASMRKAVDRHISNRFPQKPEERFASFLTCEECFGPDTEDVQCPGLRFAGRELEYKWRIPLSRIQDGKIANERLSQAELNHQTGDEHDDILCPHLSFAPGPNCILDGMLPWQQEGVWMGEIACKACGRAYTWERSLREPGSETYLTSWCSMGYGWGLRSIMKLRPFAKPAELKHILWCDNEGCHFPKGAWKNMREEESHTPPPSAEVTNYVISRMRFGTT